MKLFRKMRASSLEESNASAYWKYAIGEVVFNRFVSSIRLPILFKRFASLCRV